MRTLLPGVAALLVLASGLEALAAPPGKPKTQDPSVEAPREPTPEERLAQARQLHASAEAKRTAGDFAGALADERASNTATASPQALFGIALCLDKIGTAVEAEQAYHRFLGVAASGPLVEERRIAEERLAELGAGMLKITSDPVVVRVEIDGKPAVDTPVEVRLPPGKHVVVASVVDYEPATRDVDIKKGGVMELAVALRKMPAQAVGPVGPVAPAPPAPEAPSTLQPTAVSAGVAFGLAAVGLGVGIAYGVRAISAHDDYDKAPSQALADKQRTSAVVSDGAFGGAIACGIVGAVLVTHIPPSAPAPGAAVRLSLVPLLSTKTLGAAAALTF